MVETGEGRYDAGFSLRKMRRYKHGDTIIVEGSKVISREETSFCCRMDYITDSDLRSRQVYVAAS